MDNSLTSVASLRGGGFCRRTGEPAKQSPRKTFTHTESTLGLIFISSC